MDPISAQTPVPVGGLTDFVVDPIVGSHAIVMANRARKVHSALMNGSLG